MTVAKLRTPSGWTKGPLVSQYWHSNMASASD
jgi:hypothetical protein